MLSVASTTKKATTAAVALRVSAGLGLESIVLPSQCRYGRIMHLLQDQAGAHLNARATTDPHHGIPITIKAKFDTGEAQNGRFRSILGLFRPLKLYGGSLAVVLNSHPFEAHLAPIRKEKRISCSTTTIITH